MKLIINWKRTMVILFLAIAFIYRINTVKVVWYFPYVMSIPVILIGARNLFKRRPQDKIARFVIKISCLPHVCAILYSVLLMFTGKSDFITFQRGFSLTLQYLYGMLVAGCLISQFGKDSISVLFKSCCLSYLLTSLMAVLNLGGTNILSYIVSPLDSPYMEWFEMHDLCLSMGMFLIFFLAIQSKEDRKWKDIVLSILIIYLGFKRIGILAAIVTLFITVLIKRRENKFQKVNVLLVTIGILGVCYLYTFIVSTDIFEQLLYLYNINAMGRVSFYTYFRQFYDISILYLGKGVGFTSKQLQITYLQDGGGAYGLYGVQAIHNDVLKTFIEIGCIGSILWFYYYLRKVTKSLRKQFGYKTERAYCILLIYAFITYMTDNTMNYFIFQMVLYVLIATVGFAEKYDRL